MYAEEDDEGTRNSITSTRGPIELKAHKTIVLRKQTRTISFDRVNHSILSQFLSLFFLNLDICGHKMDSSRDESFSLLW